MPNNQLCHRILELCYNNKVSHIGSCLSAAVIMDTVYAFKQPSDLFVLSCGHAGIALYAILEKYEGQDAQELYARHGVHPCTDVAAGIICSSGSLGCGLAVACGMAIAVPDRNVYCLVSDGECAEGIVWEALAFASERPLDNLVVMVSANGYSATRVVNQIELEQRLHIFFKNVFFHRSIAKIPGVCSGLEAHYHVLTEAEYAEAIRAIDT